MWIGFFASMGPRFENRGKQLANGQTPSNARASMGPRFENRGKHPGIPRPHLALPPASMGPRFENRGKAGRHGAGIK